MSRTTKITVEIKAETDNAYLVTDGDIEDWIPRSQIEEEEDGGDCVMLTIPEWLALKKGFV